MHHFEFLHHSVSKKAPEYVLCGFCIDGVDLRTYAIEATREHWHREHEADGLDPAEREQSLLSQHRGPPLSQLQDPVRHFLGEPVGGFSREAVAELIGDPVGLPPGTTPLLGCPCGVRKCRHLLGTVTSAPQTVTWYSLREGRRPEWGDLVGVSVGCQGVRDVHGAVVHVDFAPGKPCCFSSSWRAEDHEVPHRGKEVVDDRVEERSGLCGGPDHDRAWSLPCLAPAGHAFVGPDEGDGLAVLGQYDSLAPVLRNGFLSDGVGEGCGEDVEVLLLPSGAGVVTGWLCSRGAAAFVCRFGRQVVIAGPRNVHERQRQRMDQRGLDRWLGCQGDTLASRKDVRRLPPAV